MLNEGQRERERATIHCAGNRVYVCLRITYVADAINSNSKGIRHAIEKCN